MISEEVLNVGKMIRVVEIVAMIYDLYRIEASGDNLSFQGVSVIICTMVADKTLFTLKLNVSARKTA
jgi:hypothetical protein